jgi:hypothetical protein
VRGEHFHAESSPRHNKAAFQRGADDAGEGRVKGEIVEKFETDADESEMASLEVIGATQRSAPCTPYGMPLAASVVLRPPSRKPSVCKSMIQTARLSPNLYVTSRMNKRKFWNAERTFRVDLPSLAFRSVVGAFIIMH